jgi:simple sugar transport system ATP-binding protein
VSKHFPGIRALDGVDLEVRPGEVHALMGTNGAGKSTLIKVVTGVHRRDGGEIFFRDRPLWVASPAQAFRRGIGVIYQEVEGVPALSVAENLFLGGLPTRWGRIDWKGMRRRARALLDGFGLGRVDADRPLSDYPIAVRQMVAIARAVHRRADLLIMDEPTSSLDRKEVELLFDRIRRLRDGGIGFLFVTHVLDEVYRISDRITVLRDGRAAGTYETRTLSRFRLVSEMLGRPTPGRPGGPEAGLDGKKKERGAPVVSARGLGRSGAVDGLHMDLYAGEVFGLAGLLGSGRTEAARLIFGADHPDRGYLQVNGKPAPRGSPRRSVALGLAFCPEDRKIDGVFPNMSVHDNLILVIQRFLSRWGKLPRRRHRRIAERCIRELSVSTRGLDQPMRELSGGNQQKVILARWLACHPRLLILDEPTRGIDVGAKEEILRRVRVVARDGGAVLFISSEVEEVLRSGDRIGVLRDRRWAGELPAGRMDVGAVLEMIAGEREGIS